MLNKDGRDGVIAGLSAYLMWGLLPVYFKAVGAVEPLEVLAMRVIWALPFGALILFIRQQWREVGSAFYRREILGGLSLSALFIALNWFVYIWAIHDERIFETSLGYYINPLLNILVGVVFLGERLRRLQLFAVLLAAIGVVVLTVSGGVIPWVSLVLAATFTAYAFIRKKVAIGGMPGLFVETSLLLPFAVVLFFWMQWHGLTVFATGDTRIDFWLLMAGPVTAVPLLLFALAARRVSLTTLGFMQFVAPTLQFGTGVYYGETLTNAHLICFAFIWIAVAFFIGDALQQIKRPSQTRA
jgi:chloramphenicol-sensitive protein RarD